MKEPSGNLSWTTQHALFGLSLTRLIISSGLPMESANCREKRPTLLATRLAFWVRAFLNKGFWSFKEIKRVSLTIP